MDLPPQDDGLDLRREETTDIVPIADDAVPERSKLKALPGEFVYLFKIGQRKSTIAKIVVLIHSEIFPKARLNEMMAEAGKVVDTIRLPARREEMAKKKQPISNPVELNEFLFESDADFWESVMIDKFNFKRMLTTEGIAEIDPTIKL